MNFKLKENKIFDLVSKYRTELMGVATIWVFVYHKWESVFQNIKILNKIEYFIVGNGGVGVDIFLFLSGMGLIFSYDKSHSILEFYYKRIKRILLPSLIKNILMLGLTFEAIKECVGYNYLFENMVINRVAWFINAITILYLLFPIYYEIFKRTKNKHVLSIVLICIVFILNYFFSSFIRDDMFSLINRLPIFILGILFGWYGKNINNIHYSRKIVLIFALLLLLYGRINLNMHAYDYNNAALLTICLVVLLPLIFELMHIELLNKLLCFVGACSLEVYIVQFSIDPSRFYNNFSCVIANVLLFISTIVVSWVLKKVNDYFWLLIENLYRKFASICNKR